jgi:hypothetical protein
MGNGEWEETNHERPSFIFDNYLALSPMNKTFLKYQPCGDNSLCFKTTKGIYTYPLEYCTDREYIQFIGDTGGFEEWQRHSDFYFVSPCKMNVKVFLDDCSKNTDILGWGTSIGACKKAIQYPMYGYDKANNKLVEIGNHTLCLDEVGGDKDDVSAIQPLPCVRIYFSEYEGHCFSYNEIAVVTPELIRDSTEYIADKKYVLKPVKIPSPIWETLEPGPNPIWP